MTHWVRKSFRSYYPADKKVLNVVEDFLLYDTQPWGKTTAINRVVKKHLEVIASMVQSLLAKLRTSLGEKEYASEPIKTGPTPCHSQCICFLHIPLDQDKGDPRWTSEHLPHHPLLHLGDCLRHQLWLWLAQQHLGKSRCHFTLGKE